MVEGYLLRSGQNDEISQLLLAYYLIEKAVINGVVKILYDNQPDVGLEFLYVARQYLRKLNNFLSLPPL